MSTLEYKMQVRDNAESSSWRDSDIDTLLTTDEVFELVGERNGIYGWLKYRAVPK